MDIREERNGEEEPVRDGGAVLILLATLEPVHGYRIMQGVEESTDGAVKIGPATMYTTLKKLKAAGWIVEIAEDESRILYAATDEGRAVLERDFVRRKRLVAFAEAQLGEAGEEKHG